MRKISSLAGAFLFDFFILFLRNESKISIENHLVDSIFVLELAFKRISATVTDSESLEVEFERIFLSSGVKSR